MRKAMPTYSIELLRIADCRALEQAHNLKHSRNQYVDNCLKYIDRYAILATEIYRHASTPRNYESAAQLDYLIQSNDPTILICVVDIEYLPQLHNRADN